MPETFESRSNSAEPRFDQRPDGPLDGVMNQRLSLGAFAQLSGTLAGTPFVKVVVDREQTAVHFINHARYEFHAHYIAEKILNISAAEIDRSIDTYNEQFYHAANRRFFLGILALHKKVEKGQERRFYTIETVEVDNMDSTMVEAFFAAVKDYLEPGVPLFWKPASHLQETIAVAIEPARLPRVYMHELFTSARFIALHPGRAVGRLRAFSSEAEYRSKLATLEWFDIIVMHRVPDDIPRVSGLINAHMTTPLSHTNVLAAGWQIPNAIQLGVFDLIAREGLNDQWVEYVVDARATEIELKRTQKPDTVDQRPAWTLLQIKLEEPEVANTPIVDLSELRMSDRYKYGTKAANLGEIQHVIKNGSERLLGFYRVRRPPRENLLPYLARYIGARDGTDVAAETTKFLRANVSVPRGIAIPFAIQQEFLESSPRLQQAIGKLKMALELGAREADALCLVLQNMIRNTRMPDKVRNAIDAKIAEHLSGVSTFVIRSSSNAEDLQGFSAAGIYESISRVTTADNIFLGIKEVWASMLSPRSVRLRQQVGISLDDCYMGVIVQEQISAEMGGVMVTTNPMDDGHDFRKVFINVSSQSVENVVEGSELPLQYLFNTVEGGGRTLSIGDAKEDLSEAAKARLQKLAFVGRLLQSHFSPDYLFNAPVDIEWIISETGISILQLRPYVR